MPQATRLCGLAVQVDYTPGAAVAAGDVIVQGDLVGVADVDIAANALGSLNFGPTVYLVPKATGGGTALTYGTLVYWDDTNNRVTTTAGANKIFGKVAKACLDADATVEVLLCQLAA